MTFEEMAWEFAEVFDELDVDQTNEMLAKNVPMQTLEFFGKYADRFGHLTPFSNSRTGPRGASVPPSPNPGPPIA